MRPVRPVNLSQPRLLPHIAPTGDPLHVAVKTHVTHLSWNATGWVGGKKRSNHIENLIEDIGKIFTSSIQICRDNSSQKKQLTNLSMRGETNHRSSPRSSSANFFGLRRWKFPRTFPPAFHERFPSCFARHDTTRSLHLHFLFYVAYVREIPSHDKSGRARVSYDTGAIKVALKGRGEMGVFRIESHKLSDCSTRSRVTYAEAALLIRIIRTIWIIGY